MVIIILGTPGAGRHTQGYMLMKHWGITHVSLRDQIKEASINKTKLGAEVQGYLDQGQEIPDTLVYQLMTQKLAKVDFSRGVVINGFPVTIKQLKALHKALKGMGMTIDYAVLIDVPTDESVRRLAGRRVCANCHLEYHVAYKPPEVDGICDRCHQDLKHYEEDTPRIAKKRIEWFRKVSAPLVSAFHDLEILKKVDGVASVETVAKSIAKKLDLSEWHLAQKNGIESLKKSGPLIRCAHCEHVVHVKYEAIQNYSKSKVSRPLESTAVQGLGPAKKKKKTKKR